MARQEERFAAQLSAFAAVLSKGHAEAQEAQRQESVRTMKAIQTHVSSSLANSFAVFKGAIDNAVEKAVNNAVSTHILPALKKSEEALAKASADAAAGAAAAAAAAASSKEKASPSKDINLQALAKPIAEGLAKPLMDSMYTSFEKSLLPTFDVAMQELFKQTKQSFEQNNKQHQDLLPKLATNHKQVLDSVQSVQATLGALQGQSATVNANIEKIRAAADKSAKELKQALKTIQDRPASASSQQAPAPAPAPVDPLVRLSQLIEGRQTIEAFTYALQLNSIEAVEALCTQLQPAVLCEELRLPLNILLSFINQVNFRLTTMTATKLLWLKEALMLVNLQDRRPEVVAHLPQLKEMTQRLMSEVFNNVNSLPMDITQQCDAAAIRLVRTLARAHL